MQCIDTLNQKLAQLEATPSTNAKLEIVKTFNSDELNVVALALNPSVNFYMTKLPVLEGEGGKRWDDWTNDLIKALARRDLTGNAARDTVTKELESLLPEHRNVLRRVLLKKLGCGVGDTLVNKAFPGTVPVYPYMRCSLPDKSNLAKWPAEIWAEGAYSDVKADGMFANLSTTDEGVVTLMSRQGNKFPADTLPVLHTCHTALKGYRLDGELLVFKDGGLLPREVGNGLLNSLLQEGELPDGYAVRYVAWDIVPLRVAVPGGKSESPLRVRRAYLRAVAQSLPHISVIESRIVHSIAEAKAHCRDVQLAGGEGTVLKNPEALWIDSTSKDQVKFKLEVCVDLKITGVTPGTGKNAHLFGSLSTATSDDLLEVDVSGISDDLRADMAWRHALGELVGGIVTVKANGLLQPSPSNPKHSLFLPRLVEERLDKKVADSLQDVIDQFAAALA